MALVTNIQGYSIHDGPGIRTVVFLKGCSLECSWCSNPECISPYQETGVLRNLCTGCGKCIAACPDGALVIRDGKYPAIDREQCSGCGACVQACDYKALVVYGKEMNAGEVFEAVKKDEMFYSASGGGITVSGGECLLQPEFLCDLFEACRNSGIHTCIETSGQAPQSSLRRILPLTDYVLFDLKMMDPEKHQRYTGSGNELVLSNARTVAESGTEYLFRMPLVPGTNDDGENIAETARFLKILSKNAARIELMPYHQFGKGKYESLDREYPLPDIASLSPENLERVKQLFMGLDVECKVSQ